MADGGVRNRAKLFEQNSNDSTAPSLAKKPVVANKPKVSTKPDGSSTSKESEETNPFKKFGAINSSKDGGAPHPASKFRGGLNNALTPKSVKNDISPDSNNNKSANSEEKASKEDGPSKKALLPSVSPKNASSNAEAGGKPATLPRLPTAGSKPTVGGKPKPQLPAKVPLVPKPELVKSDTKKTDSLCSTSSNSSNSSTSSSSPGTNNIASKDKGQFDFSKNLRPVLPNGLPPKKTFNSVCNENSPNSPKSESDPSSPSPPPPTKSPPPLPTSPSNSKFQTKAENTSSAISKPGVNLLEQRARLKSKSKKEDDDDEEEEEEEDKGITAPIIIREGDGKKFRKIILELTNHSASAPQKPSVPGDIDLASLCKDYEKATMKEKESGSVIRPASQKEEEAEAGDENGDDEGDDVYEPAVSLVERRPKKDEPATSRQSERVSVIPDMSAEEEAAYDDTPDELYTVAETEMPAKNEESSETEQEKKKRKKEEERKRKEKEKQEREEEKQRRKQEEEQQKRRKNFKLTGNEKAYGEGEIKDDAKGGNLNLKVRKGQKVTIIRVDNNPANKWLVKTDTQMGYVDSTNISVNADIIKQAMTRDKKESAIEEDFDQPTYDDVPDNPRGDGSTPVEEELEYEDVYEEF